MIVWLFPSIIKKFKNISKDLEKKTLKNTSKFTKAMSVLFHYYGQEVEDW